MAVTDHQYDTPKQCKHCDDRIALDSPNTDHHVHIEGDQKGKVTCAVEPYGFHAEPVGAPCGDHPANPCNGSQGLTPRPDNRNRFADCGVEELLNRLVGAGSMCWENPAGAGVFDSEAASAIAAEGLARLNELMGGGVQARRWLPGDPASIDYDAHVRASIERAHAPTQEDV